MTKLIHSSENGLIDLYIGVTLYSSNRGNHYIKVDVGGKEKMYNYMRDKNRAQDTYFGLKKKISQGIGLHDIHEFFRAKTAHLTVQEKLECIEDFYGRFENRFYISLQNYNDAYYHLFVHPAGSNQAITEIRLTDDRAKAFETYRKWSSKIVNATVDDVEKLMTAYELKQLEAEPPKEPVSPHRPLVGAFRR